MALALALFRACWLVKLLTSDWSAGTTGVVLIICAVMALTTSRVPLKVSLLTETTWKAAPSQMRRICFVCNASVN